MSIPQFPYGEPTMCEPFEPVSRDTVVATRSPRKTLEQAEITRKTIELVTWIAEDRERNARGRHVLRNWRDSLIARNAEQNRDPDREAWIQMPEVVQLPGVVVKYLTEIGVSTASRVFLKPDGSILEVLSRKGEKREYGNIICESNPLAA